MVAAAGIAACSRETVRVGAPGPWEQPYAVMLKRGMDQAVDEINRGGGVRGRRLELVYRDDSASGSRAVDVATEFVKDPTIVAVLGHVNSGAMVAASRVYDEHLVAIAPTAASPDITGISPWVFRIISSDSLFGQDLAQYASALGNRAAVLYDNNSYGRGGADAFERNFKGTIVSSDPVEPGAPNAATYITYFKKQHIDFVYVAGNTATATTILNEAHRQKFEGRVLGTDSWMSLLGDTALTDGVYIGTRFNAVDAPPRAKAFMTRFRQLYGMDADGFAALGYDAVHVLAQAITARGARRDEIREYLSSIDPEHEYHGVTGDIRFLPNGDNISRRFALMQVQRGTLVPYSDR